eukprot:1046685-Pyramimonas_sp.AAC.1
MLRRARAMLEAPHWMLWEALGGFCDPGRRGGPRRWEGLGSLGGETLHGKTLPGGSGDARRRW